MACIYILISQSMHNLEDCKFRKPVKRTKREEAPIARFGWWA